jgi:hypothetical protein
VAVYLYRPPSWRNVIPMGGALNVGIPTSTVVWRQGGVWHNAMTAGMDSPVIKDCDVDLATGLRLFFNKPMVVPDNLYAELLALAPADPSWTPGSLTLL